MNNNYPTAETYIRYNTGRIIVEIDITLEANQWRTILVYKISAILGTERFWEKSRSGKC